MGSIEGKGQLPEEDLSGERDVKTGQRKCFREK